jgi:hypothetical protein
VKVSIATIISIALCWFRLPVANPNFALHHASEIAGAAHAGSMSDFPPARCFTRCLGKAFQLFVADGARLLYEVTDPRGYVSLDLNRKLPNSL